MSGGMTRAGRLAILTVTLTSILNFVLRPDALQVVVRALPALAEAASMWFVVTVVGGLLLVGLRRLIVGEIG